MPALAGALGTGSAVGVASGASGCAAAPEPPGRRPARTTFAAGRSLATSTFVASFARWA